MDRREWLTLIYREANIFIRDNANLVEAMTANNLDSDTLRPALMQQLSNILSESQYPEEFIRFSLLEDPDSEFWQNEPTWERVVISVSMECVMYDVMGLVLKIVDGELPRSSPDSIVDFDPHQAAPLHDDTTQTIGRGTPSGRGSLDDDIADYMDD